MASKSIKKRNWAFVLYPESAPDNWRELLQQSGLPAVISPLHDKDKDPTGEPKKAHYHIILTYPGPTTFNAVRAFTDSLKQPIPQPLESVQGYYRYLTHEDNPDKYQYDKSDIVPINGFDVHDYIEISKTEAMKILKDIQNVILTVDIREYSDLLDYLIEVNQDWWQVAVSHTMMLNAYLKSRRYKLQQEGIKQKKH